MNKQISPLKIEQKFSENDKLLQGLIVYDNDVVYEVQLDEQGVACIGVKQRAEDGMVYELATKQKNQAVARKNHLQNGWGDVYDNHLGQKTFIVALAHQADGSVRGGLVWAADEKCFHVLYGEDCWASFFVKPEGIQYVCEENVEKSCWEKAIGMQDVRTKNFPVEIDGHEMRPVLFMHVAATDWHSGNELTSLDSELPKSDENLYVKKMCVLSALSKLSLPQQHKVLDQWARLIRLSTNSRSH